MAAKKGMDSPTKMTEFAPLSSEVRQSGGFFSRLFKKNADEKEGGSNSSSLEGSPASSRETSEEPDLLHTRAVTEAEQTEELESSQESESSATSGSQPGNLAGQPRTLSSVLRRLSNILDRRSQTPQAYKDSDFKQYWMPDSNCRECYECSDKFNTFRRRHHCRICGQIFCSRCCNQEVPGNIMGYTGYLRVCTYCCKVVLSYAQNPDASGDLRALSEDLKHMSSVDSESGSGTYHDTPTGKRKQSRSPRVVSIFEEELNKQRLANSPEIHSPTSGMNPFDLTPQSEYARLDSFQQERRMLTQDSAQLRDLWLLMQHPVDGIEMQSHRHRLRTYTSCLVGSELVDWLIARDKAETRVQAIAIGQALVDAKWLECVTCNEQVFRDEYALYKAGQAASREDPADVSVTPDTTLIEDTDDDEPAWFREIKREDEVDDTLLSELSKIPSTISGADIEGSSRSVFYIDNQMEGAELSRRPKKLLKMSASLSSGGSSDRVELDNSDSPDEKSSTGTCIPQVLEGDQAVVKGSWSLHENLPRSPSSQVLYESMDVGINRARGSTDLTPPQVASQEFGTTAITEGLFRGSFDFSPSHPTGLLHQDSVVRGMHIEDHLKSGAFPGGPEGISLDTDVPDGWQSTEHLKEENGERLAFERLSKAQLEHLSQLTHQLLTGAGLSHRWADIILGIVRRVSQVVRPDVRHEGDDMDIRQYVQIKKIPGGSKSNCNIVCGVVCSKNVAHKKMPRHIVNPKILLLRTPIEYQRVEHKYSSLEPQILQEHEFLKNCVGRIAALEPDVVLVEKTVSRVAQDYILQAGLTLVLNVKPSVMERVARFSQADIITSIDGLVSKTALGFCHNFKIQNYIFPDGQTKALMYFDGCASHLGCTITLRGAGLGELKRVKQILQFMVYVAYHSRLEMSFLMDEFALPTPAPDETALDLGGPSPTDPTHANEIPTDDGTTIQEADSNSGYVQVTEEEANKMVLSAPDSSPKRGSSPRPKQKSAVKLTSNYSSSIDGITGSDSELVLPRAADNVQSTEISKSAGTIDGSFGAKTEPDSNPPDAPSRQNSSDQAAKEDGVSADKKSKKSSMYSCTEVVDFSDPLHNYQKSKDESIFHGNVPLKEEVRYHSKHFRKVLDDVILSSSPYIKYEVPFLETEPGAKCKLRQYFPEQIYFSQHLDEHRDHKFKYMDDEDHRKMEMSNSCVVDAHPFILEKLTAPLCDQKTQALLADFRARGGRIQLLHKSHVISDGKAADMPADTQDQHHWESKVDCLDPSRHQRLAVLFSSYSYVSNNTPNPCVNPWVVNMDFYGRNDITLGTFLERYCFREHYTCPSESCDTPMVDHVRRFVHELGCVQILLKKLESPIPVYQNNILLWGWCRRCKQVTPVVPMSLDTWSMSFAKYLELRFHGNTFGRRGGTEPCSHSIHHDHYQYFGCKQIVASFKYFPIQLREIVLPDIVIHIHDVEIPHQILMDDIHMLSFKGTGVFSVVMERLHRLHRDLISENQMAMITDFLTQVQAEKEIFRQNIDKVQLRLAQLAGNPGDGPETTAENVKVCGKEADEVTDAITRIRIQVADVVLSWNYKIAEVETQLQRRERGRAYGGPTRVSRDAGVAPDNLPVGEKSGITPSPVQWYFKEETDTDVDSEPTFVTISDQGQQLDIAQEAIDGSASTKLPPSDGLVGSAYGSSPSDGSTSVADKIHEVAPTSGETSIAAQASDDCSGEKCTTAEESGGTLHPGSSAALKTHQRSKSLGDSRKMSKQLKIPHENSASELDKLEKKGPNTMKNILSSLLSTAEAAAVQMPFPPDEHLVLTKWEEIPVIVYDQEPSSIIAYTLSSAEYERELQELKTQLMKEAQTHSPSVKRSKLVPPGVGNPSELVEVPAEQNLARKTGSSVLSFFRGAGRDKSPSRQQGKCNIDTVKYVPRLDRDSLEEADDFSYFSGQDGENNKGNKEDSANLHIELQFADNTAKFYCRVYFAEQFKKLRKLIFPAGEERYIRSLSRCFTWLARGGKSGSTFCKTQDDRFILKQMSRLEVQSFVEFAPHYFQYITKAQQEQMPTVLAKILGVYRIGYRNSQTNTALKQDLLVMENLFYERRITQIFDLKGSMRNRLVNTSGKRVEDLVLLDENLLKVSVDSPMYIRPHSKTVLTLAITNDTQFLSSHLVMDYSLLVGLDEHRKELVVGIIDYIRTFTWDKKLEMVFKSTYSQFGGQGKMPTVVSPEIYRSRFLEAMDKYFLLVPDRWSGLGRNVDC